MGWGPGNSSQNRSYDQTSENKMNISNWGYNVKVIHGSEIYVCKKRIAVNHLFSQSVLRKLCFDGSGGC